MEHITFMARLDAFTFRGMNKDTDLIREIKAELKHPVKAPIPPKAFISHGKSVAECIAHYNTYHPRNEYVSNSAYQSKLAEIASRNTTNNGYDLFRDIYSKKQKHL